MPTSLSTSSSEDDRLWVEDPGWKILFRKAAMHGVYLACLLGFFGVLYLPKTNAQIGAGLLALAVIALINAAWSRTWLVALLIIIGTPLVIGAGEVALRWRLLGWEAVENFQDYPQYHIQYQDSMLFSDDPVLGFDFKPNWKGTNLGRPVKLNSQGYNDVEFSSKGQEKEAFRIVLLGHSFAFPEGVRRENGVAAVLESELSARLKRPVAVYNLSIPSEGVIQYRGRLLRDGLALKPDLVLATTIPFEPSKPVKLGQNRENMEKLRKYQIQPAFTRSFFVHHASKPRSLKEFVPGLDKLFNWLFKKPAISRKLAAGETPMTGAEGWARLAQAAHGHNLPIGVVMLRMVEFGDALAVSEKSNTEVEAMCKQLGVAYFDTTSSLSAHGFRAHWTITPDNGHPNAEAHGIIGRYLAAQVEPKVREILAERE
ncbi:MAG: hypothetical protein JXA52_03630 [Planctomycetes bacterium]|nr:hypothetical protein [Planctomycetota bacterium]